MTKSSPIHRKYAKVLILILQPWPTILVSTMVSHDFDTEDVFSNMINKHCRHPSILKIRENISCDSVFDFQCIHAPDIMQIIKGFDTKKAKGSDMVPMQLLQKSAPYIAPYIAKLVNNSFIKGVFPGDLKLAGVSSLFKKKTHWIKWIIDLWVYSSLYRKSYELTNIRLFQ